MVNNMKKYFSYVVLVLVVLLMGIALVLVLRPKAPTKIFGSVPATPTVSKINKTEVNYNDVSYSFSWFEVGNLDSLKLIPNFEQKLTSQEVKEGNNCKFLVNAGFYTKENTASGLFVTVGKTMFPFQQNSLFNGVVSVNDLGVPRITRGVPVDHLQTAVQSGPILIENASPQKLSLVRDERSRRTVAFVTGENKLYFAVVYSPTTAFEGPLLADLPTLLDLFGKKTNLLPADAINLDGGTASVFLTPEVSLTEAVSVGGFFCAI